MNGTEFFLRGKLIYTIDTKITVHGELYSEINFSLHFLSPEM